MFDLLNFDPHEIEQTVKRRDIVLKIFVVILGAFISATAFNMFYVPNNLVSSGLSSLGIIFSYFMDINAVTFVFLGNLILIIVSVITIGFKKSYKSIIGALLYTSFLYFTKDIVSVLNFSFDSILLYVLAAGFVGGLGEALVYKMGYSTGGLSILALIITEYTRKPIGKVIRNIGIIIVLAGGFTFGYTMIMYAIIIIFISSLVIDKVVIGISDSKMFLIITNKEKRVKKYILEVMKFGVTEFESRGAYSKDKQKILMCVVPTDKYYSLRLAILEIDEDAFIIVNDCYETCGGTKRKKIPFIRGV